ncbi:uncharacterized protein CLUP02_12336 [Colletotrichum lupini]|uniref:Uncharacterized protein n=1 Tax=Colletotrichum lupini TaxID=145971 RepID=A0A9Q8T055_9PEZI|nr:uncharacterized protein CLUP02_12336 [Colletotrichum lupini]UQC86834.1 hypothetical protein CLUP02_12336 [Colletotrichum lupini]
MRQYVSIETDGQGIDLVQCNYFNSAARLATLRSGLRRGSAHVGTGAGYGDANGTPLVRPPLVQPPWKQSSSAPCPHIIDMTCVMNGEGETIRIGGQGNNRDQSPSSTLAFTHSILIVKSKQLDTGVLRHLHPQHNYITVLSILV